MRRLPDTMGDIVQHLQRGVRLMGPIQISSATGHTLRAWGFADGRRANKASVNALATRGIS